MSVNWLNLLCVLGVVAVVIFKRQVSKRVDHGEARFDSRTGKQITDD